MEIGTKGATCSLGARLAPPMTGRKEVKFEETHAYVA